MYNVLLCHIFLIKKFIITDVKELANFFLNFLFMTEYIENNYMEGPGSATTK